MVRDNLPFIRSSGNKRPEIQILVFVQDKIISTASDVICEYWMETRCSTFIVHPAM